MTGIPPNSEKENPHGGYFSSRRMMMKFHSSLLLILFLSSCASPSLMQIYSLGGNGYDSYYTKPVYCEKPAFTAIYRLGNGKWISIISDDSYTRIELDLKKGDTFTFHDTKFISKALSSGDKSVLKFGEFSAAKRTLNGRADKTIQATDLFGDADFDTYYKANIYMIDSLGNSNNLNCHNYRQGFTILFPSYILNEKKCELPLLSVVPIQKLYWKSPCLR
jgi:hypothetical protein